MKKLLVVALMTLGLTVNAQQGKLNIGVNLGLPIGDYSDSMSYAIQPELNYILPVTKNFGVGPSLSYMRIKGKKNYADFSYLPIGLVGHLNLTKEFKIGLDLGYGIAISPDGNDGGFYYRPMLGYKVNNITFQLTYSDISRDYSSFTILGLGLVFEL